MKIKIKSKKIVQVVIVLWIIFSVGYISYHQWNILKGKALQESYNSGLKYCVDTLILEAKKPSCELIPIANDTERVDVINIQCLSNVEGGE